MSNRVTVSMGVVTQKAKKGLTFERFIETADQQLYRAKEEGRDRICAIDLSDDQAV